MNFNIKTKKYQLFMSIKHLNQFDIKIIKDNEKIINEKKIKGKISLINEIYEKMISNKKIENISGNEINHQIS